MALKRPTWQSMTGTQQGIEGKSDYAVDGNNSTDWSQGSCSLSLRNGSSSPWLAVDLGRLTHVYAVQLVNIADGLLGTWHVECI
jgi:hypothetical protein